MMRIIETKWRTGVFVLLVCVGGLVTARADDGAGVATPQSSAAGINSVIDSGDAYKVSHQGFWKFRTPKLSKPFGDDDALELSQGKVVTTDGCKVLWVGAGGATYCFTSHRHRRLFLTAQDAHIRQAEAFYRKQH